VTAGSVAGGKAYFYTASRSHPSKYQNDAEPSIGQIRYLEARLKGLKSLAKTNSSRCVIASASLCVSLAPGRQITRWPKCPQPLLVVRNFIEYCHQKNWHTTCTSRIRISSSQRKNGLHLQLEHAAHGQFGGTDLPVLLFANKDKKTSKRGLFRG